MIDIGKELSATATDLQVIQVLIKYFSKDEIALYETVTIDGVDKQVLFRDNERVKKVTVAAGLPNVYQLENTKLTNAKKYNIINLTNQIEFVFEVITKEKDVNSLYMAENI